MSTNESSVLMAFDQSEAWKMFPFLNIMTISPASALDAFKYFQISLNHMIVAFYSYLNYLNWEREMIIHAYIGF